MTSARRLSFNWGLAKILHPHQAAGPDETTIADPAFSSDQPNSIPDDDDLETQLGTVVGTIAYMSPEQANGRPLNQQSDVYSLGAILFELLCNQPPFRGKGLAVLEQVKRGEVRDPRSIVSTVPKPLAAVCLKALACQPRDRYATAKDLADEIVRWQSGEPPLAYREPWLERASRWLKRHRTLCQVAAASLIVFTAVVGAWSWQESRRVARISDSAGQHARQAQQLFYQGDLDAASNEIAKAGAIAAGEGRLQSMRAPIDDLRSRIDGQLRRDQQARQAQQKLAEFQRAYDDALFHSLLGTGAAGADDDRRALAAADRALAVFPLGLDLQLASLGGRRALTADQLREIGNRQQELLFVQADLTARRDDEGRDDRARANAALEILGRLAPDRPLRIVHLRRARYLALAGRTQEAAAEENRAKAIDPQSPLDLFMLGDEHLQAQQFAAAAKEFEQALARDPDRFWAQCFLAMAQLQMAQYGEAIANLTACAGRRPDFAWTYLLRGLAYGQQGDARSAENDFESALARTTADADRYAVFLNRGIVRLRSGRIKSATEDFETAIGLEPNRWEARVNLAEALRDAEDRRLVVTRLAVAVARPIIPLTLPPAYKAALAELNRAIEVAPNEPRPYLNRAALWRRLGDTSHALADFRTALALAPSGSVQKAQAYCELGRIAHRQGDYAQALKSYNAALAQRSDDSDALYLRGLVQMDMNNAADAVASLDQFLARSNLVGQAYRPATPRSSVAASAESRPAAIAEDDRLDPRVKLATLYRERALARMKLRDTSGGFHDATLALDLIDSDRATLTPADRDRFANLLDRRGWALLTQNARTGAVLVRRGNPARSRQCRPVCGPGLGTGAVRQVSRGGR